MIESFLAMPSPGPDFMVAAAVFYGDESGHADDPRCNVITIAGFFASPTEWQRFETRWGEEVLSRHQIPYLHMKEFDGFRRPHFDRFKNDKQATIALLKDVAGVIGSAKLKAFGAAVILEDLRSFNAVHQLDLDPYGIALFVTVGQLCERYPNVLRTLPAKMFLDRAPNGYKRLAAYKALVDTDPFMQARIKSGYFKLPSVSPLQVDGALTSKNLVALQAADFWAWELRRAVELKLPWHREVRPNLDIQTRETIDQSILEHQAMAKGLDVNQHDRLDILERRSFANLLRQSSGVFAKIVDRQSLDMNHERRLGRWPRKAG